MSKTAERGNKTKKNYSSIDQYIADFPKNVQTILKQLRKAIKGAAPQAKEVISYQMPAFRLNGVLVYFAAYKNHIGLYPTASGIEAFKDKLSAYQTSKGTIRFLIDEPVPLDLVKEIVRFKVKENQKKANKPTA